MVFSKFFTSGKQLKMSFTPEVTDTKPIQEHNTNELNNEDERGYDMVDGLAKDQVLSAIMGRAQHFESKLTGKVISYSKKYFQPTNTMLLMRVFLPKPYISPLDFSMFDIQEDGSINMLEYIRRVLTKLDGILTTMDKSDKAVKEMKRNVGNLIGDNGPLALTKLKHAVPSLTTVTWKPIDQNMDSFKQIADKLNNTRWPTLKNRDTVPADQLRDQTRQRLITLTLLNHLAKLMAKLDEVANKHYKR